jgi:hypothetical protein
MGPIRTRWVHDPTFTAERAVSLYVQYVTEPTWSPSCHIHIETAKTVRNSHGVPTLSHTHRNGKENIV